MRTINSIKNASVAVFGNFITLLFGLIIQKIFIDTLGDEYLGINSLFTNIVSMLAIVELGIGSAIIYSLYKPIALKNYEEIKSLMKFYKNSYNVIAIIVSIIGIGIMPALPLFVKTNLDINIYYIFALFVADVVFSYLLSYKRSILQADQKNYIINIVHLLYTVCMNITLIGILIISKNYIVYLITKCIYRILENVIISIIVNKKYPYIKDKDVQKLDENIYKNIVQKVKGLVFHKIGSFIVLGTDNIIISTFLGTVIVGLYSNYYMIINAIALLLSQIFSALTASVGNLLVENNKEKSYSLYKVIMFLNFIIYGVAAVGIYNVMEPFITLWVGESRILENSVLIMLTINFYLLGMRASIGVYKDAAGIFWEDRYIPLIESIVNIVVSISFVKYLGLTGVFIGTCVSSLIVALYSLPHFVYKKVFERSSKEYYRLYFKYAIITLINVLLVKLILNNIITTNILFNIIISIIITLIIPNIINFIVFRKTEEFKYLSNVTKNLYLKFKGGKNEKNIHN